MFLINYRPLVYFKSRHPDFDKWNYILICYTKPWKSERKFLTLASSLKTVLARKAEFTSITHWITIKKIKISNPLCSVSVRQQSARMVTKYQQLECLSAVRVTSLTFIHSFILFNSMNHYKVQETCGHIIRHKTLYPTLIYKCNTYIRIIVSLIYSYKLKLL